MPVIKQAIKKVRQDKRKAVINSRVRKAFKEAVKEYLKKPNEVGLKKAYIALDKAAKTNVIHKNKSSRLKSRLSKKLASSKTKPKAKTK